MFADLQIAIPSRSRPQVQKTIHNLSENLWPNIAIIVPQEQYNDYRRSIPLDIIVVPFDGRPCIGAKREFILNSRRTGKLIMFDDDLRFYKRLEDGRFRVTDAYETEKMVYDICALLDVYPHVGLTDKFMSNLKPRVLAECQRFNQVLCFNRDKFPNPWPSFRLPYAHEEHDMHLQFLTRGFKTAVSTEWSKSDKPGAHGGCQDWRSHETFKQDHAKMLELWPTIVSVKDEINVKYNWREAKRIGGIL